MATKSTSLRDLQRSVNTRIALSTINPQRFRVHTNDERVRTHNEYRALANSLDVLSHPVYLPNNINAICRTCGKLYQKVPKYRRPADWSCTCHECWTNKTTPPGIHICGLPKFTCKCRGAAFVFIEPSMRPYEITAHPQYRNTPFTCTKCRQRFAVFGTLGCLCWMRYAVRKETKPFRWHDLLTLCRECCENSKKTTDASTAESQAPLETEYETEYGALPAGFAFSGMMEQQSIRIDNGRTINGTYTIFPVVINDSILPVINDSAAWSNAESTVSFIHDDDDFDDLSADLDLDDEDEEEF